MLIITGAKYCTKMNAALNTHTELSPLYWKYICYKQAGAKWSALHWSDEAPQTPARTSPAAYGPLPCRSWEPHWTTGLARKAVGCPPRLSRAFWRPHMRFLKASTSLTPGIPRKPTVSQSFGKTTTKLTSLITALKIKIFFAFVFYITFIFLYNHIYNDIYGFIFYITWGSRSPERRCLQLDAPCPGRCDWNLPKSTPRSDTRLATCKTHKEVSKRGCRMPLICFGRIRQLVCIPLLIQGSPQSLYKK